MIIGVFEAGNSKKMAKNIVRTKLCTLYCIFWQKKILTVIEFS